MHLISLITKFHFVSLWNRDILEKADKISERENAMSIFKKC